MRSSWPAGCRRGRLAWARRAKTSLRWTPGPGRRNRRRRAARERCSCSMASYEELRAKAQAAWEPFAEPRRPLIKVGVTTCSRVVGALETLEAIRAELAARGLEADGMVTGCWGLCYAEPGVGGRPPGGPGVLYGNLTADKVPALIEGTLVAGGAAPELALAVLVDGPFGGAQDRPLDGVPPLRSLEFFAGQERRLMANCGVTDPEEIDHYIARGGYEGLAEARGG